MPHKIVPRAASPLVEAYSSAVNGWLSKAGDYTQETSVGAVLIATDFIDELEEIDRTRHASVPNNQQIHYAAIETALRNTFYKLLSCTTIDHPSFNAIWHLLDIVVILSDREYCDSTLVIWQVEELLDSQTIQGCRRVFDYLESRRERITAKHFKAKSLAILRACNELLRRLSRAEDTVFCGRVFIFLFQSFPLGDRSSVNLRGEYHVDNITAYDETAVGTPDSPSRMDVDVDIRVSDNTEGHPANFSTTDPIHTNDNGQTVTDVKVVKFEAKKKDDTEAVLSADKLYPIFWSLQQHFSMPTTLFDRGNLKSFKEGLDFTLTKFKDIQKELESRGTSKPADESRHGTKRKRGSAGEEMANSFNPKYLTSRDLFELEISDLAFRRHVLVQALILTDFLLSLTPKSKAKVENMKNKSVLYDYTLEEEDAKWAVYMRSEIANYLQQGPEGKFYYRMVDTVLLRDKNWVRWKAENCPPFQRGSTAASDFVEARVGAQKACSNKRLRATPLGSLDLNFLSDGETADGLDKFKDPSRYAIPASEALRGPIADDEFEAQTAKTEEDKQLAISARASKLWRLLRIVHRSKFSLFDRIDDGNNLQVLFEESEMEIEGTNVAEAMLEQEHHGVKTPEPAATVVISEPVITAEAVVK